MGIASGSASTTTTGMRVSFRDPREGILDIEWHQQKNIGVPPDHPGLRGEGGGGRGIALLGKNISVGACVLEESPLESLMREL